MNPDTHTIVNEDVRFEHEDFQQKPVLYTLVGIGALVVFAFIVVAGVLWMLLPAELPEDPLLGAAKSVRDMRDQGPILQAEPTRHWLRIYQNDMLRLNGFGWVNRDAGTVHIPIESAMDALAAQGMPALTLVPDSPTIPPVKTWPEVPPPVTRRPSVLPPERRTP